MRSRLALLLLGVLVALAVPAQTASPPMAKGIVLRKEQYLAQGGGFPPIIRPDPPGETTPPPASPTSAVPTTAITTTLQPIPTTTTSILTTNTGRPKTTTSVSTSVIITSTSSAPSSTPTSGGGDSGGDNQGLIVAGSAIGGLVFAIGLAIVTFKIIVARKERQRRQKEFAAALSDSYYPGGAANALSGGGGGGGGNSGYRELHDDTTASHEGGANLSRHGSYGDGHDGQPYYYKESGYSQPYVQERYGGNNGTYGMYEETEMSVIGGPAGASHGPAYPPASMRSREDYDYGYGQQQPPAYGGNYGGGGYDNYSYGKGHSGY